MSSDNSKKVNIGVNIDVGKVPEKIYDDLLSPPTKTTGKALATITDLINTALYPIELLNEKRKILLNRNLHRYKEKLDKIPTDKITNIPTEISAPIIERLNYTSNDELSNAFINLLSKASSFDTIKFAHPSFIHIIDRLSPDEANLLKYISENNNMFLILKGDYLTEERIYKVVYLDSKKEERQEQFKESTFEHNFSLKIKDSFLEDFELMFFDNIDFYIDNLISLGLIKNPDELEPFEKDFIYYETQIIKKRCDISSYKDYKTEEVDLEVKDYNHKFKTKHQFYKLTNLGESFINTCLK